MFTITSNILRKNLQYSYKPTYLFSKKYIDKPIIIFVKERTIVNIFGKLFYPDDPKKIGRFWYGRFYGTSYDPTSLIDEQYNLYSSNNSYSYNHWSNGILANVPAPIWIIFGYGFVLFLGYLFLILLFEVTK